MSEMLAIKTLIITIVIFVVLVGTVFYEEPSCITTDINPWGLLFPLLISALFATLFVLAGEYIWDKIEGRKK